MTSVIIEYILALPKALAWCLAIFAIGMVVIFVLISVVQIIGLMINGIIDGTFDWWLDATGQRQTSRQIDSIEAKIKWLESRVAQLEASQNGNDDGNEEETTICISIPSGMESVDGLIEAVRKIREGARGSK